MAAACDECVCVGGWGGGGSNVFAWSCRPAMAARAGASKVRCGQAWSRIVHVQGDAQSMLAPVLPISCMLVAWATAALAACGLRLAKRGSCSLDPKEGHETLLFPPAR